MNPNRAINLSSPAVILCLLLIEITRLCFKVSGSNSKSDAFSDSGPKNLSLSFANMSCSLTTGSSSFITKSTSTPRVIGIFSAVSRFVVATMQSSQALSMVSDQTKQHPVMPPEKTKQNIEFQRKTHIGEKKARNQISKSALCQSLCNLH